MKLNWTEFQCDHCGQADHYPVSVHSDSMARDNGWVITRKGKHYHNQECYEEAKAQESENGKG